MVNGHWWKTKRSPWRHFRPRNF